MDIREQIEVQNVSRETFEEIEWYFNKHQGLFKQYVRQIQWWNAKFNLVSRSATESILLEHVRHSLSLCITEAFWKARYIVDGGTGAGLPGLPLSIIHDDAHFLLVDVNQKKVTAVKQMISALDLNRIESDCLPVEDVKAEDASLFISKHAFKLNEFFAKTIQTNYASYLFLKGADFIEEINQDIVNRFHVRAYNLQTGTHLSFFNHKFIVQLDPK